MKRTYTIQLLILLIFISQTTFAQLGGKTALMVVAATDPLTDAEVLIVDRLESLELDITLISQDDANDDAIAGMDLLLISASVSSGTVGTNMAGLSGYTIPVINWEPGLNDDLGFSAGAGSGYDSDGTIDIIDDAHDMAAGLSGNITITNAAVRAGGAKPEGDATVIATATGDATNAVLFCYDTDDQMAVELAPARRVGTFLLDNVGSDMTEDGWSLFDATVLWALPAPEPVDTSKTVTSIKTNFDLQTYPVPANDQLFVEYSVENPGSALLELYDLSGKKVAGLIEYAQAGKNLIKINSKNHEKGIYHLTITMNGMTSTSKVIFN